MEDPLGTFLATVHEDALVASITTGKGIPGHFAIGMNAAGVHEVQEIDPSQLPVCGGVLSSSPGVEAGEADSPKAAEDQVPEVDHVPEG